jgi:hypothetical protein
MDNRQSRRRHGSRFGLGQERFCALCVAAGLILATGGGCQSLRHWRPMSGPPIPVVLEPEPTPDQVISAVNANAVNVRQLSSDVRVRIPGAPPLSGNLIVERPRNLRMKVGLIGMSELGFDVGSNDEEFWFWSKASTAAMPPTLFHARHDAYRASASQGAIPLEPQWILDSIGLVQIEPDGSWLGPLPRPDGHYELRQPVPTGAGTFTKVLVIDRQTAILRQQATYDANHQLLAYVDAKEHAYDAEHHTSLPRRIELVVIDAENRRNTMTVDLANVRINQLYGDPQTQWARPEPSGAQVVDLAVK